jgi:hypothetical protein
MSNNSNVRNNSQFLSLLFNIVIPAIILTKFSKDAFLGPLYGLLVALSFPLFYGVYELVVQKRKDFISVVGFIGVLLSGTISLLKFPPQWIAVKEASIPLLIGLIILISTRTSWQLINKIFYNREMLNIDKIELSLSTDAMRSRLRNILSSANKFLACSFFFSAAMNFLLAKKIVHSMPGTPQFNEELGRMSVLSFPVIAVPSIILMAFILWYIFSSLKKLTHLTTSEIMSDKLRR